MLKAIEGKGLRRIIYFFGIVVLATGFMNLGGGQAFAQTGQIGTATRGDAVPKTCDAEFMKSLEARAWLEAEREVVQSENFIVKPDMITGYTCFAGWLNNMANDIGLFSDGLGLEHLDDALERLISAAWINYWRNNFEYRYRGGRSGGRQFPEDTVNGAPYSCGALGISFDHVTQQVKANDGIAQAAKCENFQPGEDPDLADGLEPTQRPQEGFFTIQEYVDEDDKRHMVGDFVPRACEKDPRWEAMYTLAIIEPPWMPGDWLSNSRQAYFGLMNPDACGTAVQTGITVRLVDGTEFPDAVCPPPGCRYDQSACRPF